MRKITWNRKIFKILKSKDRDSNFLVMFFSSKALRAMRKEKGWLTEVGHNSWWHMKCAQHAAHNPKFEKMGLFRHPGDSHGQIKGPAHMVEGGHHPRNRPPTLCTTSVDFYHYLVTVRAYSTPQPNTQVPATTGGGSTRRIFFIEIQRQEIILAPMCFC